MPPLQARPAFRYQTTASVPAPNKCVFHHILAARISRCPRRAADKEGDPNAGRRHAKDRRSRSGARGGPSRQGRVRQHVLARPAHAQKAFRGRRKCSDGVERPAIWRVPSETVEKRGGETERTRLLLLSPRTYLTASLRLLFRDGNHSSTTSCSTTTLDRPRRFVPDLIITDESITQKSLSLAD